MPVDIPPDLINPMRYHAEPHVRHRVVVGVVGKPRDSKEGRILRDEVAESITVKTMLADRERDGRIPLPPDEPYRGALWVLSMLADLNHKERDPSLAAMGDQVLDWLCSDEREAALAGAEKNGLWRCEATIEGVAAFSLLRLRLGAERVDTLIERLLRWQWPDGGWSAATTAKPTSSDLEQTLWPLRALVLHAQQTGSETSRQAAARAAERLLSVKLYQKPDGKPLKSDYAALHYPCFEHYDVLFALKVMMEAGFLDDERCAEALDLLESKQTEDGGFPAERKYYRVGRDGGPGGQLINWGGTSRVKTNEMVTAEALPVLKAAGRMTAVGIT